jgi:hypothetical protein
MILGSMGLQGGQTAVWIDDAAAGPQRIGCNQRRTSKSAQQGGPPA